ncbi:alpha/beta fold hydrolase [Streptomyces cellulosae]
MTTHPRPGPSLVTGPRDVELNEHLTAELVAFNAAATGSADRDMFSVKVSDDTGELIGGLAAWTWGGLCGIEMLWVRESDRKEGWGSRMLEAAEAEARRRGCNRMTVSSFTFQAPAFYQQHGYVETGRTLGIPGGHADVHMFKTLTSEMVDQRSVDLDGGIRMAYKVSGPATAPPLVLLHALGEDSSDWDVVLPALARTRRVHALDLRGHGRSDWPGSYSLQLMRADVLQFLDALQLNPVDLIGHSMGGVVAYLLAQHSPHRIRRLVLEDAPLPRPREATTPARPDGPLSFDWEMVLAVREEIDTPDPQWLAQLDRITADTLVLAGGPTSHVPQEGVAELARRIPRARLLTIPVGHLIHDAAPEAFSTAVSAFLTP